MKSDSEEDFKEFSEDQSKYIPREVVIEEQPDSEESELDGYSANFNNAISRFRTFYITGLLLMKSRVLRDPGLRFLPSTGTYRN